MNDCYIILILFFLKQNPLTLVIEFPGKVSHILETRSQADFNTLGILLICAYFQRFHMLLFWGGTMSSNLEKYLLTKKTFTYYWLMMYQNELLDISSAECHLIKKYKIWGLFYIELWPWLASGYFSIWNCEVISLSVTCCIMVLDMSRNIK